MGTIKKTRTLFFTTSPRSPEKLIPEIKLLIDNFNGHKWTGKDGCQSDFAVVLSNAQTFEGKTSKKYSAFSARERITRSPQGLGFVDLSPTIKLTEAGHAFIYGNRPHEIFFRQLIKFQIPSIYQKETANVKGTFWGHPFLEIIRLIRDLEYLTPDELRIFALQLTDFRKYDEIKNAIILFRNEKKVHRGRYKEFVAETTIQEIEKIYAREICAGDFTTRESKTDDKNSFIKKHQRNLRDYSDACFRYLRYTEMFISDGRSLRIAPDKIKEIDHVLNTVDRNPIFLNNPAKYKENLFSPAHPQLLSDSREHLEFVLMRYHSYTKRELVGKTISELKDLRDYAVQQKRTAIIEKQEKELKSYALYQEVVDTYNQILTEELYDAPLFLEWNTWRAMTMLDGGTIKGNFKIDDSGKPIATAGGNMPDIECCYENFNLSVEVTLQRGQRQYESESEPITRHYGQLKKRSGKETYCLFIAPYINKATWAHFWGLNQVKNTYAYGGKPKIIPMELDSFTKLVENSYNHIGIPTPDDIQTFLDSSIQAIDTLNDENEWKEYIHSYAQNWLADCTC